MENYDNIKFYSKDKHASIFEHDRVRLWAANYMEQYDKEKIMKMQEESKAFDKNDAGFGRLVFVNDDNNNPAMFLQVDSIGAIPSGILNIIEESSSWIPIRHGNKMFLCVKSKSTMDLRVSPIINGFIFCTTMMPHATSRNRYKRQDFLNQRYDWFKEHDSAYKIKDINTFIDNITEKLEKVYPEYELECTTKEIDYVSSRLITTSNADKFEELFLSAFSMDRQYEKSNAFTIENELRHIWRLKRDGFYETSHDTQFENAIQYIIVDGISKFYKEIK